MTNAVPATEVATKVFLSDIAGYKEEKEEAVKIINVIKNFASFSKLGISIPKGLILAGPSGVGKTMLAKAIANEAEVPFYEFESSEDSNADSSINSLKKLFELAKENSPSIIFIDELDELISNEDFSSDYSRKALKTLLTELDGAKSSDGVLVITTTNHIRCISPALLRSGRLDKHIEFSVPDYDSRKEIADLYISKVPALHDIDCDQIARRTPGFSCADIKSLVNEAMLVNISKGIENITSEDFYEVIPTIGHKGIRKGKEQTPSELICFHEVGHFIVNYALRNDVGSLSVLQTGNVRGTMMPTDFRRRSSTRISYIPEAEKGTKADYINEICISIAGCKAEEYFFHENSGGCSEDLAKASFVLEAMLANGSFGIKQSIVHISFRNEESEKRDNELIDQILTDCENKVTEIFVQNEELIRLIAKELRDRRKLDVKEAEEIIERFSHKA